MTNEEKLFINYAGVWLPPPKVNIAQWADKERRLSSESSASPGIWRTSRAEYQREIMNALSNPLTERVVLMTAAQIGKTELLLNVTGYFADQQPSPVLILQPTIEMGESFSKDRLAPMIRDTPCLTKKFGDPKSRSSGNTLRHKIFIGGHVAIAGANSPASLASRPVRILLCDEVDRYPLSAGTEGDPLSLAMKRTQNFWNKKIFLASTPTLIETSRIYEAFNFSSREEWNVPCPVCQSYQAYEWQNFIYQNVKEPLMRCKHCGQAFNEIKWKAQQEKGKWTAEYPERVKTRGFHLNAFASPWARWSDLVSQYQEALTGGSEKIKVWINTVLGMPYESSDAAVEAERLESRREDYHAEIPDGVLALTAGVDTQDDRLECEVVGWGAGKESWGIEYRVFYGNLVLPDVWLSLEDFLRKRFKKSNGETLGVSCTFIDSAGHFTDEVYKFCKPRKRMNIYPVIGRGGTGKDIVSKPSRNNRRRVMLFTVGVSTVKGELSKRLQIEEPGPGYCHFPKGLSGAENKGYDTAYFKGLLSEQAVVKRKNGRNVLTWEVKASGLRNEPLDCRVYATAAMELMNFDFMKIRSRKNVMSSKEIVKLFATNKEPPKLPEKPVAKRVVKPKRTLIKRGLR